MVIESPAVETPVVTPEVPAATPAPAATPPADTTGITILRKGDQVFENPEVPVTPQTPVIPEGPHGASGPGPDPNGLSITPPVVPAPDEEEIEFFSYASEKTGGVLKDPDSVLRLYEEHNELKKKLAEKPEIEFENPGQKAAYEYCRKFPGHEVAAANGFYHVMSIGDVNKLSDKDAQSLVFALKHPQHPREEARKYADAKYDKDYANGLLDDDPIAKFEHDAKIKESREFLSKLQDDFNKEKPSQPAGQPGVPVVSEEERASIKAEAQKALGDFGGMKYQYFDNDPNSVVNIQMEESEAQELERWMSDPKDFLNSINEMCTENGKFSYKKLNMIFFEIKNRDRIRQQSFTSGVTYGELKKIKELKNTSTPPPVGGPPVVTASKNLAESMIAANIGQKGK